MSHEASHRVSRFLFRKKVHYSCTKCGCGLVSPLKDAGMTVSCPDCDRPIVVPGGPKQETRTESPAAAHNIAIESQQRSSESLGMLTAKNIVTAFESHLSKIPRVSSGDDAYSSSRYSRLIEAIVIAYFAKAAFIERHWQTDVQTMLAEWLEPGYCIPFFRGNEIFIEAFREELRERARTHILESGSFDSEYRDLEQAIRDVDPTRIHADTGGPFGIEERPSRVERSTIDVLLHAIQLDQGPVLDKAASAFGFPPQNVNWTAEKVRSGCRNVVAMTISDEGRQPKDWDDLRKIVNRGRQGFFPPLISLVMRQIEMNKTTPFPLG